MSQPTPNYSVRSSGVGYVGRTISAIRQHHIVVDSPSINEEINSAEVFLAGISTCGITLIEGAARNMDIPLDRIEITIDGYRSPDIVGFDHIDMHFVLSGPNQEQADALVGRYKEG